MSAPASPFQGFAHIEEYKACHEALKDTQIRLAYMDSQYKLLSERFDALAASNRALKAEKKMLMDRIIELSASLQRYEATARPEAYPRWQNLNAEDRAAFAHAVGANHVRGSTHAPRNSAPSAAEPPRTQRESAARRPGGDGNASAKQPPVERGERRALEPERAAPAPRPVMLPPPTTDAGLRDVAHPPQIIRIDEHRAPLPSANPSASPSASGKRKFVHVDPTVPPPKRNRDAAHAPQTPVWAAPPMKTHSAPPLPTHETPLPPVGPYGRPPPLPTYSAERSSATGATPGNGGTADTLPRHSVARVAPGPAGSAGATDADGRTGA